MSPRLDEVGGYRIFFYSREEERAHVHLEKGSDRAKIWLEPQVELAYNRGIPPAKMRRFVNHVEDNADDYRTIWQEYFS